MICYKFLSPIVHNKHEMHIPVQIDGFLETPFVVIFYGEKLDNLEIKELVLRPDMQSNPLVATNNLHTTKNNLKKLSLPQVLSQLHRHNQKPVKKPTPKHKPLDVDITVNGNAQISMKEAKEFYAYLRDEAIQNTSKNISLKLNSIREKGSYTLTTKIGFPDRFLLKIDGKQISKTKFLMLVMNSISRESIPNLINKEIQKAA